MKIIKTLFFVGVLALSGCYHISLTKIYKPHPAKAVGNVTDSLNFRIVTTNATANEKDKILNIIVSNQSNTTYLIDPWVILLSGDSIYKYDKNVSRNPVRQIQAKEYELVVLPPDGYWVKVITLSNWEELLGEDQCLYLMYEGVVYNTIGESELTSFDFYQTKHCK
ncbi:MAG: hypothetical protein RLP14_02485 [Owenweeksia sp.]